MTADSAREVGRNVSIREIERDGMREIFGTMPRTDRDGVAHLMEELVQTHGASVIGAECFDPRVTVSAAASAPCPLTCVLADAPTPNLGGVHMQAVAGAPVEAVQKDGRMLGTVVHGTHASECLLAGVCVEDTSASRAEQAGATFEAVDDALQSVGMDFSNVVRTWLFLDDILDWYDQFNAVRTAFFNEHEVFDRLVPASTGIGGANPAGAAMVMGVYAVDGREPGVAVQALPSPLQCPALEYGSSFSRAAEVEMPDLRRVFVSGTASIGPDGKTRHLGDVVAQTALTCEVVEAILHSRKMSWEDVTRATAYVRHPGDAGVFEHHREDAGIPELPVVVAHNTICRDELLFELEVDAVQTR